MSTMRQARRTTARRVAAVAQQIAYSEYMHAQAALDAECFTDDGDDGYPRTCRACDGDGGDRYSDYLFECEHCGGTGREEW